MQTGNIEQEVKQIVSEIMEIEPEKINPSVRFVEDLGADSMMALEMLAALEKKYKVVVPEENIRKFSNLNDVVKLIEGLLAKR